MSTTPIVKWVGGKTKLLPELISRLPKKFNRYYEPFAGGAALFFRLQPPRAVIGDMNADLIAMYSSVRDNVEDVIIELANHAVAHKEHPKGHYYNARDAWNDRVGTPVERAALFIYLNRTCFNGLWRVNKSGGFNAPIGSYVDPPICMPDPLRAASRALVGVTLRAGSYIETLEDAEAGDLVYLDPPYDETFNGYTSEGKFDQHTLAFVVETLVENGVQVLLSNNDTPLVRELYANYRIDTVKCKRAINSDGKGRGSVDEVLVVA